jgi:hypothetical protein
MSSIVRVILRMFSTALRRLMIARALAIGIYQSLVAGSGFQMGELQLLI